MVEFMSDIYKHLYIQEKYLASIVFLFLFFHYYTILHTCVYFSPFGNVFGFKKNKNIKVKRKKQKSNENQLNKSKKLIH